MAKNHQQTISARIQEEVVKELSKVAKETERSMSFHIEKALRLYLRDYIDYQIALDRLNDPSDRVISFEEMEKKVGLRD
ncbi:MAG: ribbon-helix-helix protein, CopG family [Nitrosopumilaceae archaeon]|nr:ribbon-helix-helix protein, CopG family [Nitrosopumilaceae archaeon]NIX60388.1 ribbon-helix-helix protein, CopG family [Nitrosopumilaceae archaeon]